MKFNRTIPHFWLGLGLAIFSTQGTASSDDYFGPQEAFYRGLATFTIGPGIVEQGEGQTLTPLPPFEKYYTSTDTSTTVVDFGLFVGFERVFSDKLWAQVGISGYADSPKKPQGHVWLFALPEFDTLSYNYKIQHSRVMAEGKFLTTVGATPALHPYLSWGLGAAFNEATGYQETALIPGAVATAPFANNTQVSLTWALGVGVDYEINAHWRLGMGYQFADLGSVSLGTTAASTNSQTLTIPNLYTNQLRFQFTFLV